MSPEQKMLSLLYCSFFSPKIEEGRRGLYATPWWREVSEFSSSFGLQSHVLSLMADLCPTGVVSQACTWIIYDLISLDLARAHVSLPPLVHWLHLSSVGTKDSPRSNCIPQCWGSTHSLLLCLWWPAVENSSEDPGLLLSLVFALQEPRVVRESPTFRLPSAHSCCVLLYPARLLLWLSYSMSLNAYKGRDSAYFSFYQQNLFQHWAYN